MAKEVTPVKRKIDNGMLKGGIAAVGAVIIMVVFREFELPEFEHWAYLYIASVVMWTAISGKVIDILRSRSCLKEDGDAESRGDTQ